MLHRLYRRGNSHRASVARIRSRMRALVASPVYQRIEEPPLAASDQAPPVDDVEVPFCWSLCSAIT
jgi:hypothetical protein